MAVTQIAIMYDPSITPPEASLRGWVVPDRDDSELSAPVIAQTTWVPIYIPIAEYLANKDDADRWARAQIPGATPYAPLPVDPDA